MNKIFEDGWEEHPLGSRVHYVNDCIHNENGPAIIRVNGFKEWFKYGKHHREDGPAIEDGDGYKQWWYEGKCIGTSNWYTQEDFEQWKKLKVFL